MQDWILMSYAEKYLIISSDINEPQQEKEWSKITSLKHHKMRCMTLQLPKKKSTIVKKNYVLG